MRDLKFRCWDGEKMISPDYITRDGIAWWRENSVPEYSKNIMQFTNLVDSSEKDIYESDIVRWTGFAEPELMQVYWRNGAWHFKRFQCGNVDWDKVDTMELTVIGNIYEHPELLK